jgi:Xaa-Pro aminopeptidase
VNVEVVSSPLIELAGLTLGISSDRRADIEAKQARVADLLQEVGCDSLLLLDPDNVAWLSGGATARGVLDSPSGPAVFCTPEARWLISGNVDSQRMFDEELDGLGFQLKEWPWHRGREQYLADLRSNRKVACDQPLSDTVPVGDKIQGFRIRLGPYEQACLLALGQLVAHALEATCRTMLQTQTEREVAAQISHRLIHRGVLPLHVGVAADGRSRLHRRFGFTPLPVERYAVLTATGRKYGLTCTASRSVCFGEIPADFRQEHNAACKVGAGYQAATWPDAVPREILLAGRRIYLISGYEHEWLLAPQGHLTGRAAVERQFTPQTEDLLHSGHAVTWCACAGAGMSCDSFLVQDDGPKLLTPTEVWPLKRIRIQGAECVRPDVLVR